MTGHHVDFRSTYRLRGPWSANKQNCQDIMFGYFVVGNPACFAKSIVGGSVFGISANFSKCPEWALTVPGIWGLLCYHILGAYCVTWWPLEISPGPGPLISSVVPLGRATHLDTASCSLQSNRRAGSYGLWCYPIEWLTDV